MKTRNIYIGALAALVMSTAGCTDELLNPTPESVLTNTNYYSTANDMKLAVLGIYNRLQTRKPTDYQILEMISDNLYMSTNTLVEGTPEADMLSVNPTNPLVATFWETTYNGIFRANAVLANIDRPKLYKDGEKDMYTGEAKFMRALFYFDLVRMFGGVPKVTTLLTVQEAQQVKRAGENEIYDLITEDLKDAIAKLPPKNGIPSGRANKAAAAALLAKVYVYRKDWPNAKAQLEQFFNGLGTGYGLLPNYAAIWALDKEDNEEIIFAMKYTDGTNGHALSTAFIPNAGVSGVVDRGNEIALPSWSLHKQYEEGDTRKAVTIAEWWRAANKPNDSLIWYPYVNKYAVKHTVGQSGIDLPVLRYADVVLLYAETLYASGQRDQALEALNRVRRRAFGNNNHDYTLADIPDETAFTSVLLKERQLEFAYEGERWFDLARTGRFMTVMTKEERLFNYSTKEPVTVTLRPQAHMKYFPIPQRQIEQSAPGVLEQNPGYD